MEIILAVVVGIAVIFFGALISMGNERQRKAIDDLREQIVLWAMQDLRIRHKKLAYEVQLDDPLTWLNKIATKVSGHDLNLHVIEYFDTPRALMCAAGVGNGKLIFSPLSPGDIRAWKRARRSRIGQFVTSNPLLSLPSNIKPVEITLLNGGVLFDLELPLAWRKLTGGEPDQMERLWMYSGL